MIFRAGKGSFNTHREYILLSEFHKAGTLLVKYIFHTYIHGISEVIYLRLLEVQNPNSPRVSKSIQ
jgi:hypothetical protein